MEQKNKFFVYDSYIFAFKNTLAQVRVFALSYLSFIAALLWRIVRPLPYPLSPVCPSTGTTVFYVFYLPGNRAPYHAPSKAARN